MGIGLIDSILKGIDERREDLLDGGLIGIKGLIAKVFEFKDQAMQALIVDKMCLLWVSFGIS